MNWTIANNELWNQFNLRGKILAGILSLIVYFLIIEFIWALIMGRVV